jgi:hypothetical protein
VEKNKSGLVGNLIAGATVVGAPVAPIPSSYNETVDYQSAPENVSPPSAPAWETGHAILVGGSEINWSKDFGTEVARNFDYQEAQVAREQLSSKLERYFEIASEIFQDNPKVRNESFSRLQNAKLRLLNAAPSELNKVLPEVQFDLLLTHVMIGQEQKVQAGEKIWRWTVPFIIVFYIVLIVSTILFGGNVWQSTTIIPVISIPMGVVIWAAIGSLAAILYRFYKRQPGRISEEIKWLIARPIIGIIMGALAYLAAVSGLFILSGAMGTEPGSSQARPELLWILSFLGGFSDRFFEGIIQKILGQINGTEK